MAYYKIKLFIPAFLMVLCAHTGLSQTFSISGTISDSTAKEVLVGVNVIIHPFRDSTQWKGVVTDVNGKFTFQNVKPGGYLLKATYIGFNEIRKRVFVRSENIDLGFLRMSPSMTRLKDVEITGTQIRMEQKGDTIQYNANAYKTNRDATAEDLISKMPGITSDATGLKAQGETVQQVLVDGKRFFGDDANIAIKNLPAEIIDKIEVFDRLSEQSQFTGFDDGNTSKTLNIVTKKGVSTGNFGKVYAGVGENGRYIGGGNVNAFKGERKFSVIGLTNNINQQNFSNEDILGITGETNSGGGGGGGRGGRGGGGGGGFRSGGGGQGGGSSNFMVGSQNGITTTNALGLNYSNDWDKVELSSSYFFNHTDNFRLTSMQQTPLVGDMFYTEENKATSTNFNHRLNFRLEYDIDSINSIVISPSLSQQRNRANSFSTENTFTRETALQDIASDSYSFNDGYTFSNNVLLRHRFKKRGRSISFNVNMNLNDRERYSDMNSTNNNYKENELTIQDQQSNQPTRSDTYSSNIAFTEPIGKMGQLQANYTFSITKSTTDKKTFDLDKETGTYTMFDTVQSNIFESTYISNRGGVSYRYNNRKYNIMTGVNYQQSNLANTQIFPRPFELDRSFQNLLPQASFNYRVARGQNVRIFYQTQTNAPSISQLQNVINNFQTFSLRTGNSDLKQTYQQMLTLRYGKTNFTTGSSFLIFAYGSYVQNYISNVQVTNNTFDTLSIMGNPVADNKRITYPINLKENWNARTFVTLGLPVKFIKANINLNTGFNYNRTPAVIVTKSQVSKGSEILTDSSTNLAHNYSFSEGIVLSSNQDAIDFTLSYTANYVIVKNTINQNADNNYFNQVTSLRVTWQPWKGLVFNSNVVNSMYKGLSSNFNQSIWFWNAAIGYKVLKDRSLDIRLSGFDLLNQNQSINREVTATFIEDTQSNALNRYYMLTLTYTLRKFK